MSIRSVRFIALLCVCIAGTASAGDAAPTAATRVEVGLAATTGAKVMVSSTWFNSKKWPENNAAAGFGGYSSNGYSVNIGSAGHIILRFDSPAEIAGKTITLTPSYTGKNRIEWSCKGIDFPVGTLPKVCR